MSLSAVSVSRSIPDLNTVARVDEVGVNERVARFQSRSIKTASKVEALKLVLSMIDLTTLEGQDTAGKVSQLCQKAIHLHTVVAVTHRARHLHEPHERSCDLAGDEERREERQQNAHNESYQNRLL